jgi:hypothetical protein
MPRDEGRGHSEQDEQNDDAGAYPRAGIRS